MCVIAVANTERPTSEQVVKMFQSNPHGAGIAWRDTNDAGEGIVAWKKGLGLEEIVELCSKAPLPYVAHFRIPSCGGPSTLLTHPFPIQKDVPLLMEGTSQGNILFHNGHWGAWKNTVMDASVRGGWTLPKGRWSDSRAMAWMAAHFGLGMLEFIDEKVVVFGPTELELFKGDSWTKINPGVWVSNQGWQSEHVRWDQAPFYGNRPGYVNGGDRKKKDDTSAAAADDSEDPSSSSPSAAEMDGPKRMGSGSGARNTSLTASTPARTATVQEGVTGGAPVKGPFGEYLAAVRLWQGKDIGKKSFRRARRKYEAWCKKTKQTPIEVPFRESVH